MALTQDAEFRVKIKAQDEASDEFKAMGTNSQKLVEVLASLSQTLVQFQQSLAASQKDLTINATQTDAYAKATEKLAIAQTEQAKAAQKHTSILAGIGGAIEGIATFAQHAIITVHSLTNIFFQLTDPKNLERIRSLLNIVALFARLRGYTEFSDKIKKAGDEIVEVGTKLNETGKEVEKGAVQMATQAEESFNDVATKAGIVIAVLSNIQEIASIGLLGSLAAGGVIANFEKLSQAVGTMGTAVKTFASTAKSSQAAMQNVSSGAFYAAKATTAFEGTMSPLILKISSLSNQNTVVGKTMGFLANAMEGATGATTQFMNQSKSAQFVFETLGKSTINVVNTLNQVKGAADIVQFFGVVAEKVGTIFASVAKDVLNIVPILRSVGTALLTTGGKIGYVVGSISGLAGAFGVLGFSLLKSDSTFKKLVGGSLLALSVALGGILVTLKIFASYVGDFLVAVGEKLFLFFDAGVEKAKADEEAIGRFRAEIYRLGLSISQTDEAFSQWGATLRGLSSDSKLTAEQAQELAISAMRLGQTYGFTTEQQQQLAKSITALGRDSEGVKQVTEAVQTAFIRTGAEAQRLGIDLSDTAINNSAYAESIGKVVNMMSDQEKAQAKLSLIIQRAEQTQRAATFSSLSYAQILDRVKNAQDEISSAFASGSIPIYKKLSEIHLTLLNYMKGLPPAFFAIASSVSTAAGGFLMLLGVTAKYAFMLIGLTTIISGLNALIAASATMQEILQGAFMITNSLVGAQVVAITSLRGVLLNLVMFLRGGVVVVLVSLVTTLKNATVATWGFTTAILANPLFWKSAAIIAVGVALYEAFGKVSERINFLDDSLQNATDALEKFKGGGVSLSRNLASLSILDSIIGFAKGTWKAFVNLAELFLGGFMTACIAVTEAVLLLGLGLAKLRGVFYDTKGEVVAYKQRIDQANKAIVAVAGSNAVAVASLLDMASGTTLASERLEKMNGSAERAKNMLERMVAVNLRGFSETNERLRALGSEYDAALVKQLEANAALREAMNSTKNLDEKAKAIAEARRGVTLAGIDIEKLRAAKMKEFEDKAREAQIDTLKRSKEVEEAVKLETSAKLSALEKEVSGMRQLAPLTDEEIKRYEILKKSIEAQGAEEIYEARKKREEELAAIEQKRAEKIKDMQDILSRAEMDALRRADNQLAIINLESETRMRAFDAQVKELQDLGDLREEDITLINKTREAMGQARLDAIFALQGKGLEEAQSQAKTLRESFEQMGASQAKLIDMELQKNLDDIDALERKLEIQGALTEETRKQIEISRKTAISTAEKKRGEISPEDRIGDSVNKLGGSVATFATSASNWVTAVLAIIDKLGDIPDWINSLPSKLTTTFRKFFAGLSTFLGDFIVNTNNMETAVKNAGAKFLNDLPKSMAKAMEGAADSFAKDQEAWNTVIDSFTVGLAENMPEIMVKAVSEFGKGLPKAFERAGYTFFKYLPLQMYRAGVIFATKAYEMFRDFLMGRLDLSGLFEGASNQLKNFTDGIAHATDQVFKVMDLEGQARAASIGNEISVAIDAATINFRNIFLLLLSMWRDAWDFFMRQLNAFIDMHKKMWDAIKTLWDSMIGALSAVWVSIKSTIIDPIIDGFRNAWAELGSFLAKGFEPIRSFLSAFSFDLSFDAVKRYLSNFGFPGVPRPGWLDNLSIPSPGWLPAFRGIVDDLRNWTPPSFSLPGAGSEGGVAVVEKINPKNWHMQYGGVIYAATGMMIPSKGTDTQLTMTTPGEFVVNREAASRNLGLLQAINSSRSAISVGVSKNPEVNLSVVINAKTNLDADQIRTEVVPAIERALRRKSLEGGFVLSASGVRA